MQRALRQPPYGIADFQDQRLSDWVPAEARNAQAPSSDSTDALWALVRLWSQTAGRPPRTRRYWAELAELAREAPASAPAVGPPGTGFLDRVPAYDLDRLGEQAFGQLARLLALADANCPDAGGQDADGADVFDHADPDGPALPDGREVAVCFVPRHARQGSRLPAEWLTGFAADLASRGVPAHRVVVYTNLPSPPPTKEQFRDPRAARPDPDLSAAGLRGLRIRRQQDIRAALHARPGLRRLFAGFLAPLDPPARTEEFFDGPELRKAAGLVHAHTAAELLRDQWVRLGQAGAEGDRQRLSLGTVAIDLDAVIYEITETASPGRARIEQTVVRSARHVIERGDRVLRPSTRPGEAGLLDVALIGGPGQGKSTLGQLVCQAYRVALLGTGDAAHLPSTTRALLASLHDDLRAADIPVPRVRRWPIRIALHDFANHLATGGDRSILRYLAQRIGPLLTGALDAELLEQWLAYWPWLLVLDGLDEVASPEVREEVVLAIEEFLLHVGRLDADRLILATSRPQGYRGEFHVGDFEQLRLTPLDAEAARHYAQRLADARHADDPEMREAVVARFGEAAQQPNTARLMNTPLQVTIMSLLVERRTRMPQNRFELFEAYYSTIYAREVDKPGESGRLLAEHKGHIDWMHQYVGLTLQSRAGQAESLDSVMPEGELRERSRARMVEETDDLALATDLAPKLFNAATERLVLLVAPEAGLVGFEVRSLQEFMAAKALISGPEADILPRLQQLTGQPGWHHTWLLAAAGIFTQRPHLRDGLLTVLRAADTDDRVAMTLRPGTDLAAALVEDDLARAHPRHHRLLLDHACEVLAGPTGPNFRAVADTLVRAAEQSTGAAEIVLRAVTRAIRSPEVSLVGGLLVLRRWIHDDSELGPALAGLLDRTLQALDAAARAAVFARSADGASFGAFGIESLQHFPVVGRESLAELLFAHGRPPSELAEDVPIDRVRVLGAELRTLSATPPPLFSASAEELTVVAEAVDAQPLACWPLASQLLLWLAESAHLSRGGRPPRVQGVN
ncbi:NACHT domain-containing protein [Kitasatospora sp. NPDC004531]